MQDIQIRHDLGLPAPYAINEFDGYLLIEVNPAEMARTPIWLRELMENDALSRITVAPHPGTEAAAESRVEIAEFEANVISIDVARQRRAV